MNESCIQQCDYGCGQIAKYKFKNGKWCCSDNVYRCSEYIKKRIGQKRSKDSRKRMSKAQAGHIPWNKGKKTGQNNWLGKTHSDETKKKISLANRLSIKNIEEKYPLFYEIEEMRYNPNNIKEKEIQVRCRNKVCKNSKEQNGWFVPTYNQLSERIKQIEHINGNNKGYLYCSESCKQKYMTNYQQLSIDNIKEKYPIFAKIEEMRYNPHKPKEIQVRCKNHKCIHSKERDGWFTPKRQAITDRYRCIENGNGGSYFYCSENCKQQCSLYNKTVKQLIQEDEIKAGHLDEPWYNSKDYEIWRNKVFDLDFGLCIYCGEEGIIAHHILPQKTHPELALDPENGITCCQKCHFKYGHKGECSTGNLSRLVCDRIYRLKKKGGNING